MMIKRIFLYSIAFFGVLNGLYAQSPQKLWYKKPAKVWTEALPVGNGRLGAMIFGGVTEELNAKDQFGIIVGLRVCNRYAY